jgi:hypothetical protein
MGSVYRMPYEITEATPVYTKHFTDRIGTTCQEPDRIKLENPDMIVASLIINGV